MNHPITASALGHRYGDRVALSEFHLQMAPGEIVGLVGPNGSGKTTLLKILAGFLRPTSGQARVHELDPFVRQTQVMREARFSFAPPALIGTFTAREHLRYLGALHPTPPTPADIEAALRTVGLWERRDDRVSAFSFGMRQRLALALALVPMPRTLVLDEPSDGLDPVAVLEMRAVLAQIRRDHGVTILLSSHLLVEVQELVDRMMVLSEGKTLFRGTPDELRAGSGYLRVRVDDLTTGRATLERAGHVVQSANGVLRLSPDSLTLESAREVLREGGCQLLGFDHEVPSLEACLVDLLQRESR